MATRNAYRRAIGAALAVGAVVGQQFAGFFAQELFAEAAILGIFALSLDFLASCGLVSFGHAGLLGVGAYIFSGLTVLAGLPPGAAFFAAIVGGAAAAFLVGLFAIRTAGAFFIMVTLAVAEMFYAWAFRERAFNGADGMGGVPRLDLTAIGFDLNDPSMFALSMIGLCVLVWIALEAVSASPFGRTLDAIRQNPNRVAALGGRVYLYRLAAFTTSGAIAALAGALKVQHTNFLSPDLVSWAVSGDVLIATVIGGLGTLVGAPLGAGVLVFLKNALSTNVGHWYLFLGAIFAFVALAMPRGVVGFALAVAARRTGKTGGAS
jgi:branched-chain amino acid transport system permease protein